MLLADHQAEEPQSEVERAPAGQVDAGAGDAAGEQEAAQPEAEVQQVVQDRDLEQAEELRSRVVPGEGHVAVAGGDARHEPEHADEQEDGCHGQGGGLDPGASRPAVPCVMGH